MMIKQDEKCMRLSFTLSILRWAGTQHVFTTASPEYRKRETLNRVFALFYYYIILSLKHTHTHTDTHTHIYIYIYIFMNMNSDE